MTKKVGVYELGKVLGEGSFGLYNSYAVLICITELEWQFILKPEKKLQ